MTPADSYLEHAEIFGTNNKPQAFVHLNYNAIGPKGLSSCQLAMSVRAF
jgi:hypothetical protein